MAANCSDKPLRTVKPQTEEDMRTRAEHLKKQRDLIIKKKARDREEKARGAKPKEEEEKEKFREFQLFELKKKASSGGGEEKAAEPSNSGGGGGDGDGSDDQDLAESRRNTMRIALAARMKRDLLAAEEERLTKMQDEQFAELDAKLRRVEELRDENRMREDDLKEAIRQNQNLRAINIHRSQINSNVDSFENL